MNYSQSKHLFQFGTAAIGFIFALSLSSGPALQTSTPTPAVEDVLKPFTTDGCSMWPNGAWIECCEIHDIAYWKGGTEADKRLADAGLRQCIKDKNHPWAGWMMEKGVAVGGSPLWPFSYRWGYGWKWHRGYRAFTTGEQRQVDRYLPLTQLPFQVRMAPATNFVLTAADHAHRRRVIRKVLAEHLSRTPKDLYYAQIRCDKGLCFQVFESECPAAYFLISFTDNLKNDEPLDFKKFGECGN